MTCMNYIAFDFETSGLPVGRRNIKITPETVKNYDRCRGVSLSAARFSARGRLIDTFDAIIYPAGFEISEESIKVHGITQKMAEEHGKPFPEVYRDFMKFIGPRTKTLVAHNAQFDTAVLQSEMLRHNIPLTDIDDFNIRCTLQLYKDRFQKSIKLVDLYKDIFGEHFDDAHNSLADSIACGRVYPTVLGYERVLKPIGVKKIVIGASSVATAIGNGYERPNELVEKLMKRYTPHVFKGKTKEDVANEVIAENSETKRILTDVESFKSEDSSEVEQKIRSVYSQVENIGLTPEKILIIKDQFRKILYTNHGTRNEDKTADLDDAKLMRDDTFYTYDICSIEGTLYQIVGRVDRIQLNADGSRTLVEIKNRTKGLFKTVRNYENIQCQTYLQMLKDVRYCRLVEQYNDERRGYLIEKDDEKWRDVILPKLQQFCENFHIMVNDEAQ